MGSQNASNAPHVLLTGFPGFIATRLIRRMLEEYPSTTLHLLVQERFAFVAQRCCEQLEQEYPHFAGNWSVAIGDLRKPNLGFGPTTLGVLREQINTVWHLAAVYDLAVPQSVAYAVNVLGTENLLDLCETLPKLRRLNYISTCYVAGRREGRVYEDELDKGQEFKNHYESTKFWAELKVRQRMHVVPTTIFRPAVVVGDSKGGQTAKADGPYFLLRLLANVPRWLPVLHFGRSRAQFNVVPVDFVVEAMARISTQADAIGKTFQLADPNPLRAREFVEMVIENLRRAPAVATLPIGLAHRLLGVPQLNRVLGIPLESLEYLDHQVEFDVTNTAAALAETLYCPRIRDYWPQIAAFAREHPEIYDHAV